MRPKFVIALLLFTFLVLGAIVFWKQHRSSELNHAVSPEAAVRVSPVESDVAKIAAPPLKPRPVPVVVAKSPTNSLTPEQRREAVEAEVERLQELSMNDDAASLSNILAALTNPAKEIREAAIDAAKQFGDTNAIPALKAAADATDDLQEKIAFLEAADFLTISPVEFDGPISSPTPEQVQLQIQKKAQRDARQQMLKQRLQGQNPQTQPKQDTLANPGN